MVYQNLNKNEKYHPTTTETKMSCRSCSGGPATRDNVVHTENSSVKTSMCTQLCFWLLKSQYDISPANLCNHPIFTLCYRAQITKDRFSRVMAFPWSSDRRWRSAGIWFYIDCHYHNLRMLTRNGVWEQAEHVKSPQEMEDDVPMKARTNLCRNIGALNGVSIRKNVSSGSV